MPPFTIAPSDFAPLKDAVVVLTGGSSGIGLATTQLLLKHGAKVVAGDRQPPPANLLENPNFTFASADVTSWRDLSALFRTAQTKHGRVDHAFANAGIDGRANYVEDDVDEDGELREPNNSTIMINLVGVLNTVKLAVHHIRRSGGEGSIVLTASTASIQRFSVVDYTVAKHGVLGLMRGLAGHLHPQTSTRIRVNAIAPSWTLTGLVPAAVLDAAGVEAQSPDAVAESVGVLMADVRRNQQLIYSIGGVYTEIEGPLLEAVEEIRPRKGDEEADFIKIRKVFAQAGQGGLVE